jgi:hypothetical protein
MLKLLLSNFFLQDKPININISFIFIFFVEI